MTLVVLSVLICAALLFAAGEAYFRLRWGIGSYRPSPNWYTSHEDRGWTPKRGDYELFVMAAFREVRVSINSLGFRDREVSLSAPTDRRRITIAGDSFTFGEVLTAEDRFTDRLQALAGDDVEIVNVSAPGYGTGQEYLFIRELMERGYEVGEKLIIAFFANDVLDNMGLDYTDASRVPRVPAFSVDENGELVHVPPVTPPPRKRTPAAPKPLPRRIARWFRNRAVISFLRGRAVSLAGRYPWMAKLAATCGADLAPDRTPALIVGWYTEGWEERWRTTADVLEYVSREGRFGASEVIIVYVPSSLQVERTIQVLVERFSIHDDRYAEFLKDPDRPQRFLRKFCVEHGVPLIDPTAALRAASREEPAYFLREGHLNQFGSDQLALELHRWLVARGGLPDRDPAQQAESRVPGSG